MIGPIGFTAYATQHVIIENSPETVIFDGVLSNYGDAYDSMTGEFTCPVTGVDLSHLYQARSEGGQGGHAPQLGKIQKNLSKWPFLEKFSPRVYILSTFSKFGTPARASDKKFHFGILAPHPWVSLRAWEDSAANYIA